MEKKFLTKNLLNKAHPNFLIRIEYITKKEILFHALSLNLDYPSLFPLTDDGQVINGHYSSIIVLLKCRTKQYVVIQYYTSDNIFQNKCDY